MLTHNRFWIIDSKIEKVPVAHIYFFTLTVNNSKTTMNYNFITI